MVDYRQRTRVTLVSDSGNEDSMFDFTPNQSRNKLNSSGLGYIRLPLLFLNYQFQKKPYESTDFKDGFRKDPQDAKNWKSLPS